MIEINTKGWEPVGATSNSEHYAIEPGILAAVPTPGASDDRKTALENIAFQNGYFHKAGRGGVILVFFDRIAHQSKEARQAYGTLIDASVIRATALIGGSVLGRTIANVFLGLFKSQVPVKLFGSLDEALVWAREVNRAADAKKQ